ncbi:MAG: phosphodiesterase [Bacillota bacterium]
MNTEDVMKVGVISDTHGCVQTWRQIYAAYLYDADLIIHAGDVLYHGPRNAIPAEYNPRELAQELNACKTPLVIVKGNCDAEVDQMLLDMPLTESSLLYLNGLRIFVRHGHDLATGQAAALVHRYKPDIFITGHTHVPVLQRNAGTLLLNPGSPAMSKREDGEGSLALIEDNVVKIFAAASGKALYELLLPARLEGYAGDRRE